MKIGKYKLDITDMETGEEIFDFEEVLAEYFKHVEAKGKFELADKWMLASMLELIPNTSAKVFAYLLRKKDPGNRVDATTQQMADDLGIGINSVGRSIQTFIAGEYVKKISPGTYMLHPKLLSYGGGARKSKIEKWEELS